MPTLQDLTGKLDAQSLISTHFGSGGSGGSVAGPLASLQAVQLPVDIGQLTALAGGAAKFDENGIDVAITGVLQNATSLVGSVPGVGDLLAPLESSLALVEAATGDSLRTDLASIVTRLRAELEGPRDAGFVDTLLRVQRIVGELTASGPLGALLQPVLSRIPPFAQTLAEMLPAADGLARAMGGLMSVESVLAESERLTLIMAAQVDPASLEAAISAIEKTLSGSPGSLAARVAALTPTSGAAEVDAVTADVRRVAARIMDLLENLALAMGGGEATLVYLDVDKVLAEIDDAMKMAAGTDLAPATRVLQAAVNAIRPFLPDLRGAPLFDLDDLVTQVETKVADFAAAITAFDVTQPVQPVVNALTTVTKPLATVEQVLEGIVSKVRSALSQVRDAVAALPLEPIANAIRAVIAPVAQAFDALSDALGKVQSALETVAGQVTATIKQVETALDTAKQAIDAFFDAAKDFVDQVNLPAVADSINNSTRTLAQALSKAQMQPYFDAAADAIDSAADVIDKIPFGMLPDSMKADVDEAVAPIKETDAQAAADEIMQVLQVSPPPDCKFAARGALEQAIADIKQQFDALIASIEALDPNHFLDEIDAQLKAVAQRIAEIQPSLTLEPVQDVINQVKSTVAGIDIASVLKPINDVFDQILTAIDEYSPEKLIDPIEQRVTAARTAVKTALHLDEWKPTINDIGARVTGIIDLVDPAQLTASIEGVLTGIQRMLEAGVDTNATGAVGSLVSMLLQGVGLRIYPRSFEPVVEWLQGGGASASSALGGRASRISDAMRKTRAAVASLDPLAVKNGIAPGITALQQAVTALDAAVPGRDRLNALATSIDIDDAIAKLTVNRDRFAAALDRSVSDVETLQRTGFGQADDVVTRLKTAFAPLGVFGDLVRAFTAKIGLPGLEHGLSGAFAGILAVVPPSRLTGILHPIFVAIRGRLQALVDAILNPIRDAIDEMTHIIDLLDLKVLKDGIHAVVEEVKQQISSFSPTKLLAEPLAALGALKAKVAAFDPIKAITAILDALKTAATSLLGKLSAKKLLEKPIAIFEEIIAALSRLDPQKMLAPIFDSLDQIAGQVCEGLDRTVAAFEHLQDALPGPGGGGGAVPGSVGQEIAA